MSEDLLRSLSSLLHLDLLLLGRRLLYIVADLLARLLATLAAGSGALLRRGFRGRRVRWTVGAGVRSLQTRAERSVLRLELVLRHAHQLAGALRAGQAGDVLEFLVVDLESCC